MAVTNKALQTKREAKAKADKAFDDAVKAGVDKKLDAQYEAQESKRTDAAAESANKSAEDLKTLEGNVGDSKREKVIIERRYTEHTHKIFSSTVIRKGGKDVLEKFRVPVKVAVELPIEIIAQIKGRKVAKFIDGKQQMVREFSIMAEGDA